MSPSFFAQIRSGAGTPDPGGFRVNRWRKSSYSTGANSDCVEVGAWRTSSRSNSGACIEVGASAAVIGVRDSKLGRSPVLAFSPAAWADFTSAVKSS